MTRKEEKNARFQIRIESSLRLGGSLTTCIELNNLYKKARNPI